MPCNCPRDDRAAIAVSDCRYSTPTRVWWNRGQSCMTNRCANPLLLTDPPEWAFGNTRRATVGDSPTGAIIEDADYIAVRSCFCRCGKCPHYVGLSQINTEKA